MDNPCIMDNHVPQKNMIFRGSLVVLGGWHTHHYRSELNFLSFDVPAISVACHLASENQLFLWQNDQKSHLPYKLIPIPFPHPQEYFSWTPDTLPHLSIDSDHVFIISKISYIDHFFIVSDHFRSLVKVICI